MSLMMRMKQLCLLLLLTVKNVVGQAEALASVLEYSADSGDSSSSLELSARDRVLIEESRAFDSGEPVNVLQRPTESKFPSCQNSFHNVKTVSIMSKQLP